MDEQTIDTRGRGLGRRTVVRAAVVTAWTAPLVQVVAAPTAAAVSGPADISGTVGTITRSSNGKTFDIQIPVTNSGGTPTSVLTATLTWAPSPAGSTHISKTGTVAGWTQVTGEYRWTATTQAAPGQPQQFTLEVTIDSSTTGQVVAVGTMTVNFTAAGTAATVSKVFS